MAEVHVIIRMLKFALKLNLHEIYYLLILSIATAERLCINWHFCIVVGGSRFRISVWKQDVLSKFSWYFSVPPNIV